MNGPQKGFTLIELLVCMVVGYFLVMVLITALWVVYDRLARQRSYNAMRATLSVAHDMMARDLVTIPCQRALLKKISTDSIIWPVTNEIDRGYALVGHTLKRTEGKYDNKRKRWYDSTSSVVLHQVGNCTFTIEGNADIMHSINVGLAIENGGHGIKDDMVIGLRNRLIG